MRRRALTAVFVFALASGPAALAVAAQRGPDDGPRLTVEPGDVAPGDTLVVHGAGFPRRAQITLFAGTPHGDSLRIGSAQTGRRGGFSASIRIRRPSDPHRYVVRACHDDCRVAASARFRVVRP